VTLSNDPNTTKVELKNPPNNPNNRPNGLSLEDIPAMTKQRSETRMGPSITTTNRKATFIVETHGTSQMNSTDKHTSKGKIRGKDVASVKT